MGKFRSMIDSPASMAQFRQEYHVPDDVTLTLEVLGAKRRGTETTMPFPIASIVEGGVRFPLDPLLRRFFSYFKLSPFQVSINAFRIVNGVSALNRILGLSLDIPDILRCYCLSHKDSNYYFRARSAALHLVLDLPDKDKHNGDYVIVGGNWEFSTGTSDRTDRVPLKGSLPGPKERKRLKNKENHTAIKKALQYKKRSAPKLLGYTPTYRYTGSKKSLLVEYFESSPCKEAYQQQGRASGSLSVYPSSSAFSSKGYSLSPSRQEEDMDQVRVVDLDALMMGEPFEDDILPSREPAEVRKTSRYRFVEGRLVASTDGTHSLVADRAKKRRRDTGKEIEGTSKGKKVACSSAEEWEPPLVHDDRPINTADSVMASSTLAFDLSKALLLPLDMAKHNDIDEDELVRELVQIFTTGIQRAHLLDERGRTRDADLKNCSSLLKEANQALKVAKKDATSAKEEAEKANEAKKQAEERVASMEAELKKLKERQAELEKEAKQKAWDEAGEYYKGRVFELRDKLYDKAWKDALHAAEISEDSPLFVNVPVPSKTASARSKVKGARGTVLSTELTQVEGASGADPAIVKTAVVDP